MDYEKKRVYHLECAHHTNMMGNVRESEKHIQAAYFATRCKTVSAFEPIYNQFVTSSNIKSYA